MSQAEPKKSVTAPLPEPTPGRPHTEEYERGEERALMYVNAEGVVQCSAELMRELLEQAGWERVS